MGDKHHRVFAEATDKQTAALRLVAEGMTSKQVALELDIAPRTVDQRIDALRAKLDGIPRNELMRAYRQWRKICEQTTYDPTTLTPSTTDSATKSQQLEGDFVFEDSATLDERAGWERNDWQLRSGLRPSSLSPAMKTLAVLGAALVLLMSFSLIIAAAQGVMVLAEGL